MPYIKFPTSDIERMALLRRIHKTIINQLAAGDGIIEQNMADELAAFLADYESKIHAAKTTLANRASTIKERHQATAKLETFCRDFIVVLKRRIQRNHEPEELWHIYGIQLDSTLPKLEPPDKLLEWSNHIIERDAQSVQAGYPAMVNPSAQEVQAALEDARPKISNAIQADLAHTQAQEALRATRDQANTFIHRISMLLDYRLYGQERSNVRRVKRNYGIIYSNRASKAHDPDGGLPSDSDELALGG